jgi:hypothetical protein
VRESEDITVTAPWRRVRAQHIHFISRINAEKVFLKFTLRVLSNHPEGRSAASGPSVYQSR